MFKTGTATDYADLLDKLHHFLTDKGIAFGLSYSGVGNGKITNLTGDTASVVETFTVTCTSTSGGHTTFTVVGSVSGSLGTVNTGSSFSGGSFKCRFNIDDGTTAFIVGDVFTFSTVPAWTTKRSVSGSEYIWQAPGNDGNASIYVGALAFENSGTGYYNWRLGGFTGFDSGLVFTSQPGAMTRPVLPLINSTITYWFFANGRRVVVIAKCGSTYEAAYLGLIQTYPSPGQFPYPLAVGGSMAFITEPGLASASWKSSNVTEEHRAFAIAGCPSYSSDDASQLRLRTPGGIWKGLVHGSGGVAASNLAASIWPYSQTMDNVIVNLDGSYPLLPIVLNDNTPNVYGRLDGVFATTGHNLTAETIVTASKVDYVCFPNIFRTSKADFFAVKAD